MMSVARLNRNAWRDRLQFTANGVAKTNLFNACIAFREAPEFRGRIAFDEFALRTCIKDRLPWADDAPRAWNNHDDSFATEWLQSHDVNVGRETVQQAIETVAYENKIHPVRDWLDAIKWDGERRIHDWLTYYLGAQRSDYVQHVGKAWLVSAVARIMLPGCKADHILILEGKQGVKKSTAVRELASPAWFTDELADFGSKDAGLQMRGVWIIELGELDHLSRSETGRIKAFTSRSTDRFRPPYGARLIEAPRECVFVGTVNQAQYLKDETGNRRFWPVRVGSALDVDGLIVAREQLWAEAAHCFRAGEPWWITDHEVEDAAISEQQERLEEDAWTETVREWLSGPHAHDGFVTSKILLDVLGKRLADVTDRDTKRAAAVLRSLGCKQGSMRVAGDPRRIWKRPSD